MVIIITDENNKELVRLKQIDFLNCGGGGGELC